MNRLFSVCMLMSLWTAAAKADNAFQHHKMLPDMLDQHPAVRAADQQRQAAAQEVEGARWQYFPTPSIGVENGNQTNRLLDSKTRFARLQQPLWTGGRLTAQTDRANAQADLAHATWREQRQTLALNPKFSGVLLLIFVLPD